MFYFLKAEESHCYIYGAKIVFSNKQKRWNESFQKHINGQNSKMSEQIQTDQLDMFWMKK